VPRECRPPKRRTTTGVVFEGRAQSKTIAPLGPDAVDRDQLLGARERCLDFSRSTSAKFSPSAVCRCNSGSTPQRATRSTSPRDPRCATGFPATVRRHTDRVETRPAVVEEEVPTHLAGKWSAALLELGLDQRMTCPPHIVGRPPRSRIHGASRRVHLTSKMISPPGSRPICPVRTA